MPADPTRSHVVALADASKRYGDVVAVDRVSLTVDREDIYALLGINGAGKTTLIRMLDSFDQPRGG